jgi:ribosome maturation factor RimP
MQKAPEKIVELARSTIEPMGYELVGVQVLNAGKHGKTLRIYIDHADGITLDDCAAVSHQFSGVLDVEDPVSGNYDLEVSSPGLDRPLFVAEHFARFAGEQVKIRTLSPHGGRRKFSGELKGIDADIVTISMDGEEFQIPLGDIDSARLVPQYD